MSDDLTWYDIKSAPRDGTPILAYERASETAIAWFHEGEWWTDHSDMRGRPWSPEKWLPLPPQEKA